MKSNVDVSSRHDLLCQVNIVWNRSFPRISSTPKYQHCNGFVVLNIFNSGFFPNEEHFFRCGSRRGNCKLWGQFPCTLQLPVQSLFFLFLNHQPPLDSQFPAIAPYKYLKEFCHFFLQDNTRDSIQSSSSAEDDIYERLSLKSVSPSGAVTPCDGETNTKNEESFMFPSPPKTPLESTGTGIYVGGRPGSFRASGGKGKLSTGW